MYLKSNLPYLREQQGFSQRDLANMLDFSSACIAQYEIGTREPSLTTLIRLAKIFGITIDDLLVNDLRPTGSVLSRNLKYLRKREGYRQEDMAHLLGYRDKSSYCLIEGGGTKLSVESLVNISEFFGVTVDDLLKKDLSKESADDSLSKDMRPAGSLLSLNIRYLRKSSRITQKELARLLGVEDPAVSKYESGDNKPTIEGLVNISEFFGVTVDDLLKKDLSKEKPL